MKIPYYPKNEAFSKQFIRTFDELTDSLHDIGVKWVTKKLKVLFKLKIKNPHPCYLRRHKVFVMKYILVKPEEMLELDGMSMKILKKSQIKSNISDTALTINFSGKFYCLPQLIITSEKSRKYQ